MIIIWEHFFSIELRIYEFKTDSATAVYNLEAAGEHNYYVSASEAPAKNIE